MNRGLAEGVLKTLGGCDAGRIMTKTTQNLHDNGRNYAHHY
jgi:hypothetical protein